MSSPFYGAHIGIELLKNEIRPKDDAFIFNLYTECKKIRGQFDYLRTELYTY